MKYTISGFSQKGMIELGLSADDLNILRWFIDFKDSGGMVKEYCVEEDCFYYWVKYDALIEALPYLFADNKTEDAKKKKVGGGTTLYYFKEMGEHNSSKYLDQLEKPILILQGDKDFQATVEKDFNAYMKLLSGKSNVTFSLYEGLNHAFVPSVYGQITKAKQEYGIEQHIGEKVIGDMATWILTHSSIH